MLLPLSGLFFISFKLLELQLAYLLIVTAFFWQEVMNPL